VKRRAMRDHAVAVFLKFPEPGSVKTRLAASIGKVEAVRIYRWLVAQTINQLPWKLADIVFQFSSESEEEVRHWLAPFVPAGMEPQFVPQVDGDLGARMSAAVAAAMQGGRYRTVTLVGTDCLDLHLSHFTSAWKGLEDHDAVFGPAEDGGYYLLALNAHRPYFFENVPWSTHETLSESLKVAKQWNLSTALLESLQDVDTIADLPKNMIDDAHIILSPIYQERVWGGRTLATLYDRSLPSTSKPYGESWEVVDREEAQSLVMTGKYAGKSLNDLWRDHRTEIFGPTATGWSDERFPILVKILDARDKLSIQVHPPAAIAESLNGEPKTEMWYIVDADPGAELYVGLKAGVDREAFQQGLGNSETAHQVHAIAPVAGEFIFIPSGRLHAIGAGLLIFEIQQNSDTTYRVFDWNRVGLDGNPRQLHVEESMQCINFSDVEPEMSTADGDLLVDCEYFNVQKKALASGATDAVTGDGEFAIIAVASGCIQSQGRSFRNGDFFIIPACASSPPVLSSKDGAELLVTRLPAAR
jgi:mannose-6-phosphate isomerase